MNLTERVEAMRQKSSAKADDQRTAIRSAMPPDMVAFLDGMKAIDPELKMNHVETETITAGKPGEQGLSLRDIVFEPVGKKGR